MKSGSIVIAIEHSLANVGQILGRLEGAAGRDVEILLCTAEPDSAAALRVHERADVRVIQGATGARIPVLWRDGIAAARSERVGLLTAHCVPAPDWLPAFLDLQVDPQRPAIGGWFENATDSDPVGWAIFMQRYANYSQPRDAGDVADVAGDNAAYCRSAILQYPDLFAVGFWEPEYHRRFRAAAARLRLVRSLGVVHQNRYSPRQFMRQRFEHGMEFGESRGRTMGTMRHTLMVVAAPIIPVVLFAKVLSRARRKSLLGRAPLSSWFWLLLFATAWGAGESRGLISAFRAKLGDHSS